MSNTTKGPWKVFKNGSGRLYVAGADSSVICFVAEDDTADVDANADLIACAPEMLRTLRFAAMALAKASEANVAYDDAYQEVSRTIALATGMEP